MKKLVACIMAAAMSLCTLAGCGSSSSSSSSGTGKSSDDDAIKLAVYPLPSPYFEYAMNELGLFKEYGANVELVPFADYSSVIQALDAGHVDGSIMGITEAVAPIVDNLGLSIVAMTDYSAGMDGIVVSQDIQSLSDLKGQTIAVNIGTMNHMLLLDALEQGGLTEDDVTITNMSEVDATSAFVGGSIKAASIFDPQMTKAEQEGNGHIIFSSKDVPGELADVLLISDKVIKDKSDQVQGIVNAWYAVQEQYNADPDKVIEPIAEQAQISTDDFKGLMDGIEIASLDYNKEIFSNDGKEICDLVTKVSNFLQHTNNIKEVPTEDAIKKAINGTFINNVSVKE